METTFLILLAVFVSGICILLLRDESLKHKCVNWFYVVCSGLAWYVIETAVRGESLYMTLLTVLLLCVIPMIIDGLLTVFKTIEFDRQYREKFFAASEDCGSPRKNGGFMKV